MVKNGLMLGALALAVLIGGAFSGGLPSVGAQVPTPTTEAETDTETGTTGVGGFDDSESNAAAAYQAFLAQLTINLGLSDPNQVDAAIRETRKQQVDERLASGDLTATEADALKTRIDAAEVPLGFGGHHGGDRGRRGDFGRAARGRDRDGDRVRGVGGRRGQRGDDAIETPIPGLPEAADDDTGTVVPEEDATPALTFGLLTAA